MTKKHDPQDDNIQDNSEIEESQETKKDDLLEKIEGLSNIEKDLHLAEERIHSAEEKAKEMEESYKRALADLNNFRRRSAEEKQEFAKYASKNLLMEILPCYDHLRTSLGFIPEEMQKENWVQGFVQAVKFFEMTMQRQEVEEIPTVGQKLNPELHDAIMQEPGEKDVILKEVEKGYKYKGKVIRHAKVCVGNGE